MGFVTLLQDAALQRGAEGGIRYLVDGENRETRLTYPELDLRARALGAALRARGLQGQPVLLPFPSDLDFIEAFFGCLYAGAIAVPLLPPFRAAAPRRQRALAIIRDSGAKLALTTQATLPLVEALRAEGDELADIDWLAIDTVPLSSASAWQDPGNAPEEVAFLQYTSGSTARPRGVMVTHANLLDNCLRIQQSFRVTRQTHTVSWLPLHHDMGLVGAALGTIYSQAELTFMSPLHFLQRPYRWLAAISRLKATVAGGPNFAYELCVRKVSEEERATLDLSSLEIAFCGAEPVHADTLREFVSVHAPRGLRAQVMRPVYGLAEGTLMVSSPKPTSSGPQVVSLDAASLEQGSVTPLIDDTARSRKLVGCGEAVEGSDVVIVDPETRRRTAAGAVGEIWVSGPSVAKGYWNNPEDTAALFGVEIAGEPGKGYLRTGDLGFVQEREVFIVGRRKDLIIIDGRNHYPQDIERTVEQCGGVRPGGSAAFSLEVNRHEKLVVLAELDKRGSRASESPDETIEAIRRAVLADHAIAPHAVVLLRSQALPKTASGKIQRFLCRNAFVEDKLTAIKKWQAASEPPACSAAAASEESGPATFAEARQMPAATSHRRTRVEVERWLKAAIAKAVGVDPADVDAEHPFVDYGLGSRDAVGLTGQLEAYLGVRLEPTLFWDKPSIRAVAEVVCSRSAVAPRTEWTTFSEDEPIAVVGIGCRFPGANDAEEFRALLWEARDLIREVPASRWDLERHFDPNREAPGKAQSSAGGFLERIDTFDATFFGISPREAAHMDPQQRLLLEVIWEGFEDALQPVDKLAGSSTGVFIGATQNEYGIFQFEDPTLVNSYSATGSALGLLANRASYVFDFKGPSMTVDTICSSGLSAIHLACQSLRRGECQLAVAGAVNLMLTPNTTIGLSKLGVMSLDNRCRAFDAAGDGIVRGEGLGIVILKPLARALADGDLIHAVLRGSAMRQDGRSNGIAAPNGDTQEQVIREALQRAGVSPLDVAFVECHGTGTVLGDPIEAKAVGAVVSPNRPAERPCYLGSVKTNIGHLEAVGGVASLIKAILAVRERMLPANLHFDEPNPYIPFDALRLRVPRELMRWPYEGKAIAGVSAWAFGGTDVHVVVEEPPAKRDATDAIGPSTFLVPLSAQAPGALEAQAKNLYDYIASNSSATLARIAASASLGRSHLDHRLALVCGNTAELKDGLAGFLEHQRSPGMNQGRRRGASAKAPVFVFSGLGGQWKGMCVRLLDEEPVFKETLVECDRLMRAYGDSRLLEALTAAGDDSWPLPLDVIQPAVFAVQVGLARLWLSWGVTPSAIVGQSLGEVAAAHIAGVLSLEDAVHIACVRSKLLARIAGRGIMANIGLSLEEARVLIQDHEGQLDVAGTYSPNVTLIAGSPEAVREFAAAAEARGVYARIVQVDLAAHSSQLDPFVEEMKSEAQRTQARPATIPIYSTVYAALSRGEDFDAAYWAKNLRQPILFTPVMEQLLASEHDLFIEIGPHPLAVAPMQQNADHHRRRVTVLPSMLRDTHERRVMLDSLGALYALGCEVRWERLVAEPTRRVRLPKYPWQHQSYWLERDGRALTWREIFDARRAGRVWARSKHNGTSEVSDDVRDVRHPFVKEHAFEGRVLQVASAGPHMQLWETELGAPIHAYLNEHCVWNSVVIPTAVFLELIQAATAACFGHGPMAVCDLHIRQGLFLGKGEVRTVQLVLTNQAEGIVCELYGRSVSGEGWTHYVSANVIRGPLETAPVGPLETAPVPPAMALVRSEGLEEQSAQGFYDDMSKRGMAWGPNFRSGLQRVWAKPGQALGEIVRPEPLRAWQANYYMHPAVLDAVFQVFGMTIPGEIREKINDPVLLSRLDKFQILKTPPEKIYSHAVLRDADFDAPVVDVRVFDEMNELVAIASGMQLVRLGRDEVRTATRTQNVFYDTRWQVAPARKPAENAQSLEGGWLILGDRSGFAAAIAKHLEALGVTTRVLRADDVLPAYAGRGSGPEDEARIRAHIGKVLTELGGCCGVLHAWALDITLDDRVGLERSQRLGVGSLLGLVQTIKSTNVPGVPRIWVATRGGASVTGDTAPVQYGQAPLWAMSRVVAAEHPELWGGIFDFAPDSTPDQAATWARAFLNGTGSEPELAMRGGLTFVPRLAPIPPTELARNRAALRCDPEANYLITGGLGSLATHAARFLAQRGARHITLIGRSRLDALDAGKAQRFATLGELRQQGVSLTYHACDVADETAVRALLAEVKAGRAPRVRGVVHTAGEREVALLTNQNQDSMLKSMRSKVVGAWVLDRALDETPLDFFVLFSSAVQLAGIPGASAYAASNAFLDALAHSRRARGKVALSIEWGIWPGEGMAEAKSVEDFGSAAVALTPAEYLAAMELLMLSGTTCAAVLSLDWQGLAEQLGQRAARPYLSLLTRATESNAARESARKGFGRDELLALSSELRPPRVNEYLQARVAECLGYTAADVDTTAALSQLGLDSLTALKLRRRVEDDLGVLIPLDLFFKGYGIRDLATELLRQSSLAE